MFSATHHARARVVWQLPSKRHNKLPSQYRQVGAFPTPTPTVPANRSSAIGPVACQRRRRSPPLTAPRADTVPQPQGSIIATALSNGVPPAQQHPRTFPQLSVAAASIAGPQVIMEPEKGMNYLPPEVLDIVLPHCHNDELDALYLTSRRLCGLVRECYIPRKLSKFAPLKPEERPAAAAAAAGIYALEVDNTAFPLDLSEFIETCAFPRLRSLASCHIHSYDDLGFLEAITSRQRSIERFEICCVQGPDMTPLIEALRVMDRVRVLKINFPGDCHPPRPSDMPHLQVARISWGLGPVPGPVLFALLSSPALRAVSFLPSTRYKDLSSAADVGDAKPSSTFFPALRRLSTGVDDPQLLPLLANMANLIELGIAVDWVRPSVEQFTPLAGMTHLERLSLTCP
ncbi:hypothetical protein CMUS01_15405 [Colletotrichum musicola]|uniref:F-box domain-containing protein n=1 Tax=Colletotrichum musicola TaxID=2175873 RepID=A0A8H6IXI0_9PEZI|nr:hypothetical protein CMUS01_15405 [Colletotrichum musicola]